jgi:hypothetical protein
VTSIIKIEKVKLLKNNKNSDQHKFWSGEMAEWSNAPDLKSDELIVPGVRIPLSPTQIFFVLFYKIVILGL